MRFGRPVPGRRRIWGVFAAIALLAGAMPAAAETLQDALIKAYQSNPQLLAERAQLRSTDEDMPQALSNWRPTVSITAQQGYDHVSNKEDCSAAPPGIFGSSPDCSYKALNTTSYLRPQTYGLQVTQPLYRGGRTVAETDEALGLIRAERAHLIDVEQTVFVAVITDYMNVIQAQEALRLNIDNEQFLRHQVDITHQRFKNGELTRTDVAQASGSYDQAVVSRRAAEVQLQVARTTYQKDVGEVPPLLTSPTTAPELPTSRDEAGQLAAMTNPTVIAAQFNLAAAEANIRLMAGQFLPTLSLQGLLTRAKETEQVAGVRYDNREILAQLQMPLYQGGGASAQVRQAVEAAEAKQNQVDDARRTAVQNAQQAWEQVHGVRDSIATLKTEIADNEVTLQGVQLEAKTGERTVFDILYATQELFLSRLQLLQYQRDDTVIGFTLAQAIGRLSAKTLGLPVQYYDPDEHYERDRSPDGPFDDLDLNVLNPFADQASPDPKPSP